MNVLGSAAHVILFEATDPFADRGLDFSLCFHDEAVVKGVIGLQASGDHNTKHDTIMHLLSPFHAIQ